jgi:hypothetical protein
MAETNTADLQEKSQGYKEGLAGYLQSQTQPQNFMEHPATAMIPIIGPILHVSGQLQMQKRLRDATIQGSEFHTMVQSGKFPEGPEAFEMGARMGLPLPLIASGILESQKVRATPGYQGRQLFEQAMPSWNQKPMEGEDPQATTKRNAAAFQAFAQQNPEVFGALGNPETGRLGLQNIYTPTMLGAMRQRGMQTPSWDQGGESGQTITQTPMQTPQAPETPQVTVTPQAPHTPSTPPTPQVPTPASLTPAFHTKVKDIATRLGAHPDDLMRVMSFETGGTFNPAEPNRAGSSGRGLLQFLSKTAAGLGTTTEALERMTPEAQLDYVEKYLAPYKGRIGTLQDLYMAVLYPDAIGKDAAHILFRQGSQAYTQNAGLDIGKKGYVTVGDATTMVQNAGNRRAEAQAQAQAQTPQARTQASTYRPFNPNGPAQTAETTMAISPSGPTLTMKDVPLADRAAAHLTQEVLRNPRNYRQAYLDLAQKGALPPEARMKEIQLQAASAIYQDHEQTLINQGFKPNTNGTLEQEALRRTADDMGVLSPEVAKALMDVPTKVGAVEFLRETAKNRAGTDPTADLLRTRQEESAGRKAEQEKIGTQRGALSPSGYGLREAETQQHLSEDERKQLQTGQIRANMPLSQLPDGPALAQKYGVPPETSLKDLHKRVLLPDDLQKEGAGIDKLVQGLEMVKRYYVETDPLKKGTFLANIQGHLKGWGQGIGLNPNVKDYKEMVTAFARILGTITTETGGKYTKEDVEQYLMAIPNEKLTSERAFQRFQAFEEMVTAPYYSRLKSYLSGEPPLMQKFRERYPEVGAGQGAPQGQPAPTQPWDPQSGKPKVPFK